MILKVSPKIGDIRVIKKFAWLPVEISGITIWWQSYYIKQQYTARVYCIYDAFTANDGYEDKWVDIDESINLF